MSELHDYYGMKINRLCEAVKSSDEELVDKLLADESFSEINEGASPLYFINYIVGKEIDDEKREKILRIFRKILNNERFNNVNTTFYDGNYSSTLLDHLLKQKDSVFETCSVELIKSPKYQLIDYPSNYNDTPSALSTAVIQGKKRAAKAIMDHPDFTKIDFSFGGKRFVEECDYLYHKDFYIKFLIPEDSPKKKYFESLELIMKEYVLREYDECYDATDTNIAQRLTEAIQTLMPYVSESFLFPPLLAACSLKRKDNDLLFAIINHPKFTGEMLLGHIKHLALELTDIEAYEGFKDNKKIEKWSPEICGNLAYYLITHNKVGLLKALIENDNICPSEHFYSYYKYYLKNAIYASVEFLYIFESEGYTKDSSNDICRMIEEKYAKQFANQQIDTSKLIELTEEDYYILQAGMSNLFGLVYKNLNYSSKQNEAEYELMIKLSYNKGAIGPFSYISDQHKVWKLFSEYQSFDRFREIASIGFKKS